MNPQAESLNEIIRKESPVVYDLLSRRGREFSFPKKAYSLREPRPGARRSMPQSAPPSRMTAVAMRLRSIANSINIPPDKVFPYAPSSGRPDIRKKWKEMILEKNPLLKGGSFSNPVVTLALTHGLSMLGYLFVDEGETLILSDLYWENYSLIFENAYGARFQNFSFFSGEGLDLDSFRSALCDGQAGVRKIMLNFPNNPSRYTPTEGEAARIVSIIRESAEAGNRILVVLDDAYFGLVYEDGVEKQSLFSYLCDAHENVLAVKIDGPTKEDYVWGCRVGFITYGIKNGSEGLYRVLEEKTGGAIRGNISNAPNISQSLLMEAYNSPDYEKEKKHKYDILRGRYESVKSVLKQHAEYAEFFKPLPCNSGYFMCVSPAEGIDAEAVRVTLLKDYDTGLININGLLRVAYSAVSASLIPELFENLYGACRKVAGK
jgi:aspartate/methionine/tyrosine aminotransferase